MPAIRVDKHVHLIDKQVTNSEHRDPERKGQVSKQVTMAKRKDPVHRDQVSYKG